MRDARDKTFSWSTWRERLRVLRPWRILAAFGAPRRVLSKRHLQGAYRGNIPFLVVERVDGSVVHVGSQHRRSVEEGEGACILISGGSLFDRQCAALADESRCGPQSAAAPGGS